MAASSRQQAIPQSAYAGLDFIKAAFCPLEFNAMRLAEHPVYKNLRRDEGIGGLEGSEFLNYPRQFPYTDVHGNRRTGTQMVTAAFGMASKDFDMFLGLYTYLKRLPELPDHLTVDFIARQLHLPATCAKDYLRLRSR